jgi:hypothetical protein
MLVLAAGTPELEFGDWRVPIIGVPVTVVFFQDLNFGPMLTRGLENAL